jgi:very-short-patch-repair endonuclease
MNYPSPIVAAITYFARTDKDKNPHKELRFCQSPIETEYLLHLLLYSRLWHGTWAVVAEQNPVTNPPHDGLIVWPQRQFGSYRIDFSINDLLFVECDGHDFHERTKEQAARDRERDRFCQLEGRRVLRFTGAEIVRDAWSCAGQTWDHLLDMKLATSIFKHRNTING